jgi:hypothetical protein
VNKKGDKKIFVPMWSGERVVNGSSVLRLVRVNVVKEEFIVLIPSSTGRNYYHH